MRCLPLLLVFACSDAALEAESGADAGPGMFAPGGQGPGGAGGAVPGSGPAAPGEDDPLGAGRDEFCAGEGSVLEFADAREVVHETCAGDIAETVFTNSVCACEDLQLAGYLRTRGFDSRQGAFDEDSESSGAPVSINGTYLLGAGYTDVGGSFTVAGAAGLTFVGYLRVLGDLRLAAAALIPGAADVGRDAWLGGDFTSGPLDVGRDLHHQGNMIAIPLDVVGQTHREQVRIDPPCPCDELLDVQGVIDRVRRDNDNEAAGVWPEMFTQTVGLVEHTLPCGRYYVDEISGLGEIRIRVEGRVVIAVGGAVAAAGSLRFDLAEGAEIDLFIGGDLGLVGVARFGDEARPAATRIYVAGAADIVLVGAAAFVGNLYAPRAAVTAPGYLRVFGSLFARRIEAAGYAHVAYDRAVLDLDCGEDDPPPPGDPPPVPDGDGPPQGYNCDLCSSCYDGLACLGSRCVPCTEDRNCCSGRTCVEGRCVNL